MRQVVVYRTTRGDWIAECPSLPGCVVQADSKVAAIDAVKQAIDRYIEELKANHAPIPPDHVEVAVLLV
jgi:predicted RNase H-like HicB family nuclease